MASVGDRDGLIGGNGVVLAHEPSFMLGRARIDPSTRRVETNGQSEIIEPRMMQVLVVLARANGEVVTRDEIVQSCWDGRIVGEDAVNRIFFRLRQLAQRLGSGTFRIETIPRVGYRLAIESVADMPVTEDHRVRPFALSRRAAGFGAVALGAAALAGKLAFAGNPSKHTPLPEAKRYFDLATELREQASLIQTEQSIAYLKEAVRIDPDYSDAWGALANRYRGKLNWGAPRPDAAELKIAARSAADRALALDPKNADARFVQLLTDSPYQRWGEVEDGLRKIVADHPGYSDAQFALSVLMGETGRWGDAIGIMRKLVTEGEPTPARQSCLSESLLAAGRFEEAEGQIATGWRLWPRRIAFWIERLNLLLLSGRTDEAMRFMYDMPQRPLETWPFLNPVLQVSRAVATGDQGDRAAALATLRKLGDQRTGDLAIAAMLTAQVGDADLSFAMYDGYFFDRGPWRTGPMERRFTSGLFRPETAVLRRDARFGPLIDAIGLERYWKMAHATPTYRFA